MPEPDPWPPSRAELVAFLRARARVRGDLAKWRCVDTRSHEKRQAVWRQAIMLEEAADLLDKDAELDE